MGVFNRAIPKYIRNPITGSISVEPTVETVHVDDAFDPVLNKAVREQYMSRYGNPITATVAGYADLVNNALLGNQKQGGTMLPGIGILSGFGRTMDKAGDVILGSLTEGVKGATVQGVESPFYNIFVEDEDYSGQRLLAAATNSMAKLTSSPEVTEEDFKGIWTVPSLGIELATDPSILGGTLKKVADGTGAVAEAGRILQEYDDIMARFAIDATAPGLRPLGKKFGAKIGSYVHNLRSEKELEDAILWADNYIAKTVVDLENGTITEDEFNKIIKNVTNRVSKYKKLADKDVIAQPLKEMANEVAVATDNEPLPDSFEKFLKDVGKHNDSAAAIKHSKQYADNIDEALSTRQSAISEVVDFISKHLSERSSQDISFINDYRNNPQAFLDDFNISKAYLDTDINVLDRLKNKAKGVDEDAIIQSIKNAENMRTKDDVELDFLQKFPQEFTTKYNINSRQDFLNLLNTDLTTEQSSEINSVLNSIAKTQGVSNRGRVKVSQSLSKLSPDLQAYVHVTQQNIVSNILTRAVHLGLINPKDIDENTLDNIVNTIYSRMRTYESVTPNTPFGKAINRYNLLNHYRFNFNYLANKLLSAIKPAWDAPAYHHTANTLDFTRNNIRDSLRSVWQSPESFSNSLAYQVNADLNGLADELKLHTKEDSVKLINDFMKKRITPNIDYTYSNLVKDIMLDENNGAIKYSRKSKFKNLASRGRVRTSDAMEEFGQLSKLISDYTDPKLGGGALKTRIPLTYRHPREYYAKEFANDKHRDRLSKHILKYARKEDSLTRSWDELAQYIQKEIVQYEKNIGSKLGSRYFSEGTVLKDLGKTTTDNSLGISKFINDRIASINFKDPIEVYKFLHTKIRTSKGDYSLADLGFEITHLPKDMLQGIEEHTTKAFKTPFTLNSKTMTLQDLIVEKMLKNKNGIRKASWHYALDSRDAVSKFIISEEEYNKHIADVVGMSFNEFATRCKTIDVTKLVYDKSVLGNLTEGVLTPIIEPSTDNMYYILNKVKRVKTHDGMLRKFRELGIPLHIRKEYKARRFPDRFKAVEALNKLLVKDYILVNLENTGVPVKYLENAKNVNVLDGSIEDVLYSIQHEMSKELIFEKINNPALYLKSWFNDFKYAKVDNKFQFLNRLNPKLGKMSRQEYSKYLEDINSGRDFIFNYLNLDRFDLSDAKTHEILTNLKNIDSSVDIRDYNSVLEGLQRNAESYEDFAEKFGSLKTKTDVITKYTTLGNFSADFKHIKELTESKLEASAEEVISKLPDETFEQLVTNEWKIYQEADLNTRAQMINKMFPDKPPVTASDLKLYEQYGKGGQTPLSRIVLENHPEQFRLYDILSKEFKNSIVSKQDRNAVLSLPKIQDMLSKARAVQEVATEDGVRKVLTLLDKQRGSVVKGSNFLTDVVLSDGVKFIAYDKSENDLIKNTVNAIKYNISIVNNAAGGEVVKLINYKNAYGKQIVGYGLVGNQDLWKNLRKKVNNLKFKDVEFEPGEYLDDDELSYLTKYSPVTDVLHDVQNEASKYYTKLGFNYDNPEYFKHTFKNTTEWQKYVKENYYDNLDLDIETSEGLSEMIVDLGYLGDFRGQFGTLPGTRRFEGNISRYKMFEDNLEFITKGTFSKGIFANEKFQTTLSLFDNDEFKINNYCKTVDDIKNIVGSEANSRNLTIASVKYNNGMISGFTKYDNTSDSSLAKALKDDNAIVLPTHIFATLDKFCKHKSRMSNKAYAFINRYLTAPFKIGILLNPGFLLGNINDAYLKQATTMSNKYGTDMVKELTNVAESIRDTIYLNNKFTDVYDDYLADLAEHEVFIPANHRMSLQVAKSKSARDTFIKYVNGNLKYLNKETNKYEYIVPRLSKEDTDISRAWIYLNAVQPTEGITKELAGEAISEGSEKVNYAKNPIDRLLYGLRHYSSKNIKTHGALNNVISKSVFGISEGTESIARSAAILNDLKHQGIDLTEFGKILGSGGAAEFRIKMINAINAMHNSNFDYNATSPVLEGLESFVPFPTFWLKNIGYWFDMFINHPQYIDAALTVNEGLWANEDTSEDEFKADAKARGAVPMSAFSEQKSSKISKFFRGVYKPSPLQSMFTAFNAINNPVESLTQRVHPLIQGAGAAAAEKALNEVNLTTNLFKPDDVRYRPYNTDQYQPNINLGEEEFNPLTYTAHKLNPFDRLMNTYLRTPGKVEKGEAQLSDFLPSVFQPDFSKK